MAQTNYKRTLTGSVGAGLGSVFAANGWKHSLNGTFVNSTEVTEAGYFLQAGDIISIGDTKLRVEAY